MKLHASEQSYFMMQAQRRSGCPSIDAQWPLYPIMDVIANGVSVTQLTGRGIFETRYPPFLIGSHGMPLSIPETVLLVT